MYVYTLYVYTHIGREARMCMCILCSKVDVAVTKVANSLCDHKADRGVADKLVGLVALEGLLGISFPFYPFPFYPF